MVSIGKKSALRDLDLKMDLYLHQERINGGGSRIQDHITGEIQR